MERREAGQDIDRLLLPFVEANDEVDSRRFLEELVCDHAEPIIKNIIRHKLRTPFGHATDNRSSDDAEEMHGDIIVQLLSRLNECRDRPDDKYISNFRSYVAAVTYSAWNEYLRRKYPQRHMLKNRVRYLLTHRPSFAVWEGQDQAYLCGLAAWVRQKHALDGTKRIQKLRGGPQSWEQTGLSSHDLQRLDLASLVSAIFKYVGSAVELDDLVGLMAEWNPVSDHVPQSGEDEAEEDPFVHLSDKRPTADVELERRRFVQQLWLEIRQLNPKQRAALLLNLKDADGGDVVSVFPIAGVATLREIAEALEFQPEHLASIWNDLPLDDLTIASHLGITRQQVINLRKSARERLARRMKAF